MKKAVLIALFGLPLMANAGLLDSVTQSVTDNVTSSVKQAAGSAKESAMNSASDLALKSALGIKEGQSNKQAVESKFGKPTKQATEAGLEVWTYDLNAIKTAQPTLEQIAKDAFKDTDLAKKGVVIKFDGDTVKKVDIAALSA
ncbi:hypothetical protein SAMN05880558_11691 [Aeromonas sp. RU39B]|jgi:hypothetical protein|uniref:hypothetical protein n=1 Tax=Aeromonas sp. RU39B TaxID=1907416 RepID=UPI000953A1A9|nr:hypothetical protein [Aeromonas sp. RU39B]SIR55345.1 hypothetical protein SAMN05880558_11691 [Aeromonas sp. RU39B]